MGEPETGRSVGQRFVHGLCGALLGALIGLGVQFWTPGFHWWLVGVFAAVGLVLGLIVGDEAIDFLKNLFWWT